MARGYRLTIELDGLEIWKQVRSQDQGGGGKKVDLLDLKSGLFEPPPLTLLQKSPRIQWVPINSIQFVQSTQIWVEISSYMINTNISVFITNQIGTPIGLGLHRNMTISYKCTRVLPGVL